VTKAVEWRHDTIQQTSPGVTEHRLMWGTACVASVWSNGTWHTWDRQSTGGENASEPTVERAKREALAALVRQNARPYKGWQAHAPRCAAAIVRACALAWAQSPVTYQEARVLHAALSWKARELWSEQRLAETVDALHCRQMEHGR